MNENSSHYSITVIELEGCTRRSTRITCVRSLHSPRRHHDRPGAASAGFLQPRRAVSKTSAGLSTISVMPSLPEPAQSAASSQTCFFLNYFFQSVTFKHLFCKTEKAAQGLSKCDSGAEKTKKLSDASLAVRNKFSLQHLAQVNAE